MGEYSALCCAESLTFEQTINLLKFRGMAMQNAVPNREGGMVAILGVNIKEINEILDAHKDNFKCFIANDNSVGQIVVSGKNQSLELFCSELKKKKFKFVKLPVGSPFHCPLMSSATDEMRDKINETNFKEPKVSIISNVTANPTNSTNDIKRLLIDQIEKPVRWRESINNMIKLDINHFIEIGPGKILSGLVKRINRNVILNQVNTFDDIKSLIND